MTRLVQALEIAAAVLMTAVIISMTFILVQRGRESTRNDLVDSVYYDITDYHELNGKVMAGNVVRRTALQLYGSVSVQIATKSNPSGFSEVYLAADRNSEYYVPDDSEFYCKVDDGVQFVEKGVEPPEFRAEDSSIFSLWDTIGEKQREFLQELEEISSLRQRLNTAGDLFITSDSNAMTEADYNKRYTDLLDRVQRSIGDTDIDSAIREVERSIDVLKDEIEALKPREVVN